MARDGRPGRKGSVANGASPASLPGLAVMRVRDGVLSSGRRGDDWRGAFCGRWMYSVTCTRGTKKDGQMFETLAEMDACVFSQELSCAPGT